MLLNHLEISKAKTDANDNFGAGGGSGCSRIQFLALYIKDTALLRMLSLVQEHFLDAFSSRSVSKTRPGKYIFAVFAMATALLHQQDVTKTLQ